MVKFDIQEKYQINIVRLFHPVETECQKICRPGIEVLECFSVLTEGRQTHLHIHASVVSSVRSN